MSSMPIRLPLTTLVDDRIWSLYGVDYQTADGKFSTYIYAISFEHAAAIVEELKQTATLGGQIIDDVHNQGGTK